MKVIMIDMLTGAEHEFSPKSATQYVGNLPIGRYKTVVRELTDGYFATIEPVEFSVDEKGVKGINPSITVTQKRMQNIPVRLNRGDYTGSLTLVLKGRDAHKTTYTLKFENAESIKNIELPLKLDFDVYVADVEGYGIQSQSYTASIPVKELEINLIKGSAVIPVPLEKDELEILINKAKTLEEKDYESASWSAFEIELDKAEKIYKDAKATQESINEIVENLQKAMNALVAKNSADKAKLKAKIEEAEQIYNSLDDAYDDKSKEFLQISIEGAKIVYKSTEPKLNTAKHINDVIDLLDRAIKNLKRKDGKVDKSNLGVLLKKAEEYIKNENLYTKDSINNLKTVYELAKDNFENEDVKEADIKNSISDLTLYISLLESKADRSELKKEIDLSSKLDLKQYKIEGKAEFRIALEKAKEVYSNKKALEDEIRQALNELKAKREALISINSASGEMLSLPLQLKTIDKKELSVGNDYVNAIAKVKNIEGKYIYTISLNTVNFELNGETISSDIIKLSIVNSTGIYEIDKKETNGKIEYIFESNKKLDEQKVVFTIDVLQELGDERQEALLVFDWANANK